MSEQRERAQRDVGFPHADLVGKVRNSVLLQNVVDRYRAFELRGGLSARYTRRRSISAACEVQKFSRSGERNHAAGSVVAGLARRRNQVSNQSKNRTRSSALANVKRAFTGSTTARAVAASLNLSRSRA